MNGWSARRIAVGVVLAAWAGLFWFLLVSGRSSLYLSPRTSWVVPVGGVVLSAAAAGRLATARAPRAETFAARDAWGLALIAVPVVIVLALPPSSLGSFAAARRQLGAGFVGPTPEIDAEGVSLAAVAAAGWSPEARRALVERAGATVAFEGIVTRRNGMPADEFLLTRFIISCCVADALGVQVRVVGAPPGRFPQDQWVRVRGTLYPVGREVIIDASEVERIPQPEHPYLSV